MQYTDTDNYSAWAEYRCGLTDFIIKNTPKGGTAAIYGAGACDDFDLQRLTGHFEKICLIDRDKEKVASAADRYPDRLEWIGAELGGITGEQFDLALNISAATLKNFMFSNGSRERIGAFADKLMNSIARYYEELPKMNFFEGVGYYDYSIAAGVHSQLNNLLSLAWYTACRSLDAQLDHIMGKQTDMGDKISGLALFEADCLQRIEQLQRKHTGEIIEAFNNRLLEHTRYGSILGIELENTAYQGSPVDGAYEALIDIRKRLDLNMIGLTAENCLRWPLRPDTEYKMWIGVLSKVD